MFHGRVWTSVAQLFLKERERESEGRRRGGREGKRRRKKKKKTEGGTSREFLTVVVINGSRWRIVKKKRSRVKVGLVERRLYVRHFVFMWPLSAGYIYVALSDSRCIRWYGIPREYISSVSETISREINPATNSKIPRNFASLENFSHHKYTFILAKYETLLYRST